MDVAIQEGASSGKNRGRPRMAELADLGFQDYVVAAPANLEERMIEAKENVLRWVLRAHARQ
jgi:hypothetical protein